MLEMLNKIRQQYEQLTEKLSDPETFSDQNKYRKIAKEHAHLSQIVEKTKEYETTLKHIKEAEEVILEKNENITASITYAKRIQEAIMPSHDDIIKYFPESCILSMPKDIVSGDFFWVANKNGKLLVAAADCTGHGVPGAFMSLIGMNFLNKIVIEKGYTIPGTILDKLKHSLKESLHQTEDEGGPMDALDLSYDRR